MVGRNAKGRSSRHLAGILTRRVMMNRLMVNVLHVGMAAALAAGVAGCNRDASADAGVAGDAAANGPKYAKVVSVDPVRETVNTPKQVCHDEVVNTTTPPKD